MRCVFIPQDTQNKRVPGYYIVKLKLSHSYGIVLWGEDHTWMLPGFPTRYTTDDVFEFIARDPIDIMKLLGYNKNTIYHYYITYEYNKKKFNIYKIFDHKISKEEDIKELKELISGGRLQIRKIVILNVILLSKE